MFICTLMRACQFAVVHLVCVCVCVRVCVFVCICVILNLLCQSFCQSVRPSVCTCVPSFFYILSVCRCGGGNMNISSSAKTPRLPLSTQQLRRGPRTEFAEQKECFVATTCLSATADLGLPTAWTAISGHLTATKYTNMTTGGNTTFRFGLVTFSVQLLLFLGETQYCSVGEETPFIWITDRRINIPIDR